jgi:hypothetical protein
MGARMKRSQIQRKAPMRRQSPIAYDQGDVGELRAACVPRVQSPRKGVIARIDGEVRAAAKSEPKRNPALLEMAKGRECLLCPPGMCRCTPGSTVAAHSNLLEHGKGKGRKADDCYSVWAGFEAHQWLDQGPAPASEKEAAFMKAHLRQVLEWRRVATDPSEPERFRKAARWALTALNATSIGALE